MPIPPSVAGELAELTTAAARYDPANPDERVAAAIVAQARDLLASVKTERETEAAEAVAEAWAELKTLTAPAEPTRAAVKAVLEVSQRIHRAIAGG